MNLDTRVRSIVPAPRASGAHDVQVRHLGADFDLLSLHQAFPERYPHLLESVAHGNPQARFDILFAFPGETLAVDAAGVVTMNGVSQPHRGFLTTLDDAWRRQRCTARAPAPFFGGWFVYLGYELVGEIEPRVPVTPAADVMPIAFATRFHSAVIRDRQARRTFIVAEPEHAAQVPWIEADVAAHGAAVPATVSGRAGDVFEDDPAGFVDGVERVKRYIRNGDVFQVNLSRAWRVRTRSDVRPGDIYARLRATNPAPFSGLATWNDCAIISSSPERLVHVAGDVVQTRPIAGTRPRGATAGEDAQLSATLLAHPKERAEHVMLIDLERNDLGRICVPGTVRVNELMVLESYAHVHHIVSNVIGRLRADVTPGDVVRAVFPGGTITGCPKVRCMEIIAELERTARGPYTGSFGYLNRDGSLDFNILIRTLVKQGDVLSLRAGAGIVADSIAHRELDETRAKARGLLLALGAEAGS